jgi:hypothetical protein
VLLKVAQAGERRKRFSLNRRLQCSSHLQLPAREFRVQMVFSALKGANSLASNDARHPGCSSRRLLVMTLSLSRRAGWQRAEHVCFILTRRCLTIWRHANLPSETFPCRRRLVRERDLRRSNLTPMHGRRGGLAITVAIVTLSRRKLRVGRPQDELRIM